MKFCIKKENGFIYIGDMGDNGEIIASCCLLGVDSSGNLKPFEGYAGKARLHIRGRRVKEYEAPDF